MLMYQSFMKYEIMIIALLNQKGGVGKTTVSIHLATAFAMTGASVLLADADPQGSALDWSASRQSASLFPVIGLPKGNLHKELPRHADKYDYIFIDGPPRVNDLARSAIMASDLVVIPVQPSPYDIWAVKDIIDMLQEASIFKKNLRSLFLINRKIVNTAIGRDVSEILEQYNTPVLKYAISQRVSFAETAAIGTTVLEADPQGMASMEIKNVTKELQNYMMLEGVI